MKKKTIRFALLAILLLLSACKSVEKQLRSMPNKSAKNIIFVIVDGMGFNYVKAARIYNGMKELSYEQFPCASNVTTCSFDGADQNGHCLADSLHVTDSAAGATAIATGRKVKNGAISRELPHSNKDLMTILELSSILGKSTGVVSTKLFSDATPAAFVSHANDRDDTDVILKNIFQKVRPNVIFGADNEKHRNEALLSPAAYRMVHSRKELLDLHKKCSANNCPFIYGGFGQYDLIPGLYKELVGLPLEITPAQKFSELDVPHLSEMTKTALELLSQNSEGFFLMVESSMTDMIGHGHEHIDKLEKSPSAILTLIHEMMEVEKTINVIKDFMRDHKDTLVVLTSDHETGGLVIDEDKTSCLGQKDCVPTVRWTAGKYEGEWSSLAKHTKVNVPLYAAGMGAQRFCKEVINNTDIKGLALAE